MVAAVLVAAIASGPTYSIPADQVQYVQCVAERESHGNPRSTNRSGGYFGMFQMTRPLANGATWMMLDWLATWNDHPKRFAAQLRAVEPHHWPRNIQIAAMVETLNHRGKWTGARHWAGGRYPCPIGAK